MGPHIRAVEEGYVKLDKNKSVSKAIRNKKMKIRCRKCFCSPCTVALLIVFCWIIWFLLWIYAIDDAEKYGKLVTLSMEVSNRRGAFCLDGSPPGYYIRKAGEGSESSWVIFLEGGDWCWNVTDCYDRSHTTLGSTAFGPEKVEFNGILSNDRISNPDFYNWNAVMIKYCDGGSFSGNLSFPVSFKNKNIYLRGIRILDTVMKHLKESEGLDSATEVIFGGTASGGLAVFAHADHIRQKFDPSVKFHALADGGYLPMIRNSSNYQNFMVSLQRVYNLHQVLTGSLNKACLASKAQSEAMWQCFFPEFVYPHIQSKIFVLDSMYNSWAMWYILNMRCHPSKCKSEQANLNRYQSEFLHLLSPIEASKKDGMYVTSCFVESQASEDTLWNKNVFDDQSPQQAFHKWYFSSAKSVQSKHIDCQDKFNCNPQCDWSTYAFNKIERKYKKKDFFVM
ncbi:pectin acetylesterase 8-like [Anneissia japonica]|uniref:pectin acetylesterase 8-like n=1 Tax=Anneissia japonica TaxID=1529436 RepID=UPI001425BA73|nr:pectin acetylesterase 8-like [Anneissia japonica]